MSIAGDLGGGKSDIKMELELVLGNERTSPCGDSADGRSVSSVSTAGNGDIEMGSVKSGLRCGGGETGCHSSVADGTDDAETAELVDGVGDECPERPGIGDMELIEGHPRVLQSRNRVSTSCGRNRWLSGRLVLKLRSMLSSDSYVNST